MNALTLMTLALGSLVGLGLHGARQIHRTVVEPVTCTPRAGLLDRLLAKNWNADQHINAALRLQEYGHLDHAKLHLDIADRRLIEERLEAERAAWARSHPVVRELRTRQVLV